MIRRHSQSICVRYPRDVCSRPAGRRTPQRRDLLADDLGYRDIGCYEGPVTTPALDGLAAGGVLFSDFHSGAAVCSPSRATFLTGRQHLRAGVYSWIADADASGIRVQKTFARTLARYRMGILAWYDHPISTGPLEGTNNKIKTLKRQAYGFRDHEYFKLKIMAIHHSRFDLIG